VTPIYLPEQPEVADSPDVQEDMPDDLPEESEPSMVVDPDDEADLLEETEETELPTEEIFDLKVDLKEETVSDTANKEPLLDLQSAIELVPAELRKEMANLLRAEFHEVIRWKAPK
jgi:hypothetical protein